MWAVCFISASSQPETTDMSDVRVRHDILYQGAAAIGETGRKLRWSVE